MGHHHLLDPRPEGSRARVRPRLDRRRGPRDRRKEACMDLDLALLPAAGLLLVWDLVLLGRLLLGDLARHRRRRKEG